MDCIYSSLKIGLITFGSVLSASSIVITELSTLGGSLILNTDIGVGILTFLSELVGESISIVALSGWCFYVI